MEATKLAQLKSMINNATELKCWQYIDALGGHIFKMEHDYADGLDKNPELEEAIEDTKHACEILIDTVCEKYQIIPIKDYPKVAEGPPRLGEAGQPLPAAPEGKTYYWDWYKKIEAEASKKK